MVKSKRIEILVLTLAAAISGCADGALWEHIGDNLGQGGGDPAPSCADVRSDFELERDAIQSCGSDEECGQVLTGTSCGCTRNLVARLDATTERFYELLETQVDGAQCVSLFSTCDCPPANGFVCDEGLCAWNYAEPAACGNAGLTCDANSQFCIETIGGVPDPDGNAIFTYECADAGACTGDLARCDCLAEADPFWAFAGYCDDSGALPQVTIAAP